MQKLITLGLLMILSSCAGVDTDDEKPRHGIMGKLVYEAANALDEVEPGWAERINIGRLNLSSNQLCILGQLYSDLSCVPRKLHELKGFYRHIDKSFWEYEIRKRRQ